VTSGAAAPAELAGWLDVRASAAVAGRFLAVERELHRRLGVLAGTVEDPLLRCGLAAASMGHAWRAALFELLLPVSVGLPGEDELAVLPPADSARLDALDGGEGTLQRLHQDVYARLLEEYEATAAGVPRVSDGPLALAATRAAADLRRILGDQARPPYESRQPS
jgi:hypothetical protein